MPRKYHTHVSEVVKQTVERTYLSLHDEPNGEGDCRIVGQVDVPDLDHFCVLHFVEGFNDACLEGGYFD